MRYRRYHYCNVTVPVTRRNSCQKTCCFGRLISFPRKKILSTDAFDGIVKTTKKDLLGGNSKKSVCVDGKIVNNYAPKLRHCIPA